MKTHERRVPVNDQAATGLGRFKPYLSYKDCDFFVRSGPGTVKLPPESARQYIQTRF